MIKQFTSKTQKIGEIGEDVACMFLVKKNFKVIERNYTKKWGEIDIVAQKENNFHFFEVKTISCDLGYSEENSYIPEAKIDKRKLMKMSKAIKSYLGEKNVSHETHWQIDVLTVLLDIKNKQAKVEMIEDVVF